VNRFSKYIVRLVFALSLSVIGLLSVMYIAPEVDKKSRLEKKRDELDSEILLKKNQISKLIEMQQDFGSDHEFVEFIGHQNKRVWKNEVIFVFDSK